MSACQITGQAEIQSVLGAEAEWVRCDPEIHVADELLNGDPTARRLVEEVYTLGEHCPHEPHTRHARLIPGRAPANAQIGNPT